MVILKREQLCIQQWARSRQEVLLVSRVKSAWKTHARRYTVKYQFLGFENPSGGSEVYSRPLAEGNFFHDLIYFRSCGRSK